MFQLKSQVIYEYQPEGGKQVNHVNNWGVHEYKEVVGTESLKE